MSIGIPETTIAAVCVEHGKPLELKQLPTLPQPLKPEQVLVQLTHTGLCHTDLHVIEGSLSPPKGTPVVPGHEGVGKVVAVGANVIDCPIGTRVCVPWLHYACRRCEYCISGFESLCKEQTNSGFSVPGSFSQYVIAEAPWLGRIPENVSDEQAAPIACAGVTVYKALKVSELQVGQFVVILGAAGGLGHLCIQYAKVMGLKVIAVDSGAEKMPFLKEMGSDYICDASVTNVPEYINSVTKHGAHGCIVLAPLLSIIKEAVQYMRPNGSVVLVALPTGDFSMNTASVILKGLKVKGSIVGNRNDLQEALDIAADGKVKCSITIYPFKEINAAVDNMRENKSWKGGRRVLKF